MKRAGTALLLIAMVTAGCLARGYKPTTAAGTVRVTVTADASRSGGILDHAWEFMTGSCNPSLYFRPGWAGKMLGHLADVHQNLGIQTVRFHAIFLDALGVYRGPGDYNFDNVDRVYDSILAVGVKPFVELSFTPKDLAACESKGFSTGYGPVTCPPKDFDEWGRMVQAFAEHLVQRYGADEVRTWNFEVWNEPNLRGFWDASEDDYLRLYAVTARAVKAADPGLKVGGPATCSAQPLWIWDLKKFCQKENLPLDFISTHTYANEFLLVTRMEAVKAGVNPFPGPGRGHFFNLLATVRAIVDQPPFPGVPFYITEWNSTISYGYDRPNVSKNDHDLPNDAAFMVDAVYQANGLTQGFSHWSYSDIFEEMGLPTETPEFGAFHGGYGIITVDGIHKPSYHAFAFLHRMGRNLLEQKERGTKLGRDVMITLDGNTLGVIAWNWLDTIKRQQFIGPTARVSVAVKNLPASMQGKKLVAYRIDWDHGNAFPGWEAMGKPYQLTEEQAERLRKMSDDTLRDPTLDATISGSELKLNFDLPPAGVVFLISE